MTRAEIVAGSAVLLSALLVTVGVRSRAPSIADAVPVGERKSKPLVQERSTFTAQGAALHVTPQRQAQPQQSLAVSAPAIVLPRIVDELRIRYPQTGPLIERLEYQLASEVRDPLRSAAMETRILGEVSRKALGLELVELQAECRITLCRVQMTFPQELARKRFAPAPPGTVWTGEQPISFFFDALDLEFQHTLSGLDGYGTPLVVGYVTMPVQRAK